MNFDWGDSSSKEIAQHLSRLGKDRNKVDYEDYVSGLTKMADLDLQLARKVISIIDTL